MPRAGVHARLDLPAVRAALQAVGLPAPDELPRWLRARHRAIDANRDARDAQLHFMRGPAEEPAPKALADALEHARERARLAVGALREARAGGGEGGQLRLAVVALADLAHVVRDSYSRGHALRAPGPGGPVVRALRSWGEDRKPHRGFGLLHVLRHDLRFEWPLRDRAPEVGASDEAVLAAVRLVAASALDPAPWEPRFERDWARFVRRRFLPPEAPRPRNAGPS